MIMKKICGNCVHFSYCTEDTNQDARCCYLYKTQSKMKDLVKNWKFWVAIAAALLAIVAVVLFFTVPKFAQVVGGGLVGLIIGFAIGFILGKKGV